MIAPRMDCRPAVSVITPFYNRADYLQDIVDTLREQTFRDFELVAVDDGSEDDLRLAIAKLETDFPIRLIRLDRNKGAASARNAGLDNCEGRYVAFLDSDDAWMPEKLFSQFQQLESAKDRKALVSLTRQLVVGARTYEAPRRLLTRVESVGEYLFRQGGVIQSSMMFMTADLAKSVRFQEGGRGHDDWSFALRLEQAGARFEMLPASLTIYNDAAGRVRRSPAYSQARFDWLEQWRGGLGEGPYFAARAAFVSNMSDNRSPRALHAIVIAVLRGAIPPWRGLYYAAALAFPAVRELGVFVKDIRLRGKPSPAIRHHGVELENSGKGYPSRGSFRRSSR